MSLTEATKPVRIVYNHYRSSDLTRIQDRTETAGKLGALLENLSRQTSLQFKVGPRTVQKWSVVEGRPGAN